MSNNDTAIANFTVNRGGGYDSGAYNYISSDQEIRKHIYGLLWAMVVIIFVLTIFNTVCCLIFLNIKFSISRDGDEKSLIFKENVVFKEKALYNDYDNRTSDFEIYNNTMSSLEKICNINIYNETLGYFSDNNNDDEEDKYINYLFFNKTQLNTTIPGSVIKINSGKYDCDSIDLFPIVKEIILSISGIKNLINEVMNP